MKLKPHIPKLIHFQKYNAIFIFLIGMAVFTLVSRAADSFMVPQVSVSSPEEMKLKYPLEIEGRITAKKDCAIYCQENLRIAQVQVQAGDIVKKGDLLFSIDNDNLQANIQQMEQELQKLDLQIKDSEQSWRSQASQHDLALNRAKEDYTDISNTSDSSVNAAYQELENARNELALHDSQKPNICETENDNSERVLYGNQKSDVSGAENDNQTSLETPNTQDLDISDEGDLLEVWMQKHAELEQILLEKQKLYEEAVAAKNEALKTAARQIEDASQPLTKDNSAALLQMEKTNLAHILQKLQNLSQTEGNVYSEYDGQISECTISTGSITSPEPVIILADFSQPFQFEGILDDMGELSIETGMEGTLKMNYDNTTLEHVKIRSISQETNGTCRITADLDAYEISQSQEAILDISKESKRYPCCVPLSALYSRESGDYVIRIQEKSTILGIQTTAECVPVTLLEKNGQYAAVEGNLSSSDLIIVNASKIIKEGNRIRIIED